MDRLRAAPERQGIAALMMLNMIEHSPMRSYGHNSVEALHTIIEAKKLATRSGPTRGRPGVSQVPQVAMLSKDYAARRAREIDPSTPTPKYSRARCRHTAATPRTSPSSIATAASSP
jgi:gamma-glutamyltranspeptidase/glutathione hydrolase